MSKVQSALFQWKLDEFLSEKRPSNRLIRNCQFDSGQRMVPKEGNSSVESWNRGIVESVMVVGGGAASTEAAAVSEH